MTSSPMTASPVQSSWSKLPTTVDDELLYQTFVKEVADDTNYDVVFENDELLIKKKVMSDSSFNRVKATGIMHTEASPHVIKQMLWDWPTRLKWDQLIAQAEIVEKYSPQQETITYAVSTPFSVSQRDFVQYRAFRYIPEKNMYHLYYKSIVHKSVPEKQGFVRAETLFSGFVIEPLTSNPKYCRITMISQIDFKGMVPSFVINQFASRGPKIWFNNLNTACEKFGKEVEKVVEAQFATGAVCF